MCLTGRGSILGRGKRFFSSPELPDRPRGHQVSYLRLAGVIFLRGTVATAWNRPPPNPESTNEWSCISTPTCLHDVGLDNFTFHLLNMLIAVVSLVTAYTLDIAVSHPSRHVLLHLPWAHWALRRIYWVRGPTASYCGVVQTRSEDTWSMFSGL